MAAYTFETISAADALAFDATKDTLTFTTAGATATAVTVAITDASGFPLIPASFALTFGGVTKTFGEKFIAGGGVGNITGQIIGVDGGVTI